MDIAGKVHRAFAENGIPSGRVGTAEKLYLQADAYGRLFYGKANDFFDCLPGGTAGSSAHDRYRCNFPVHDVDIQFRSTEPVAVFPQTILPGKPASGGGGGHALYFHLFSGSHHRNTFFPAQLGQVIGKVRMFKEV